MKKRENLRHNVEHYTSTDIPGHDWLINFNHRGEPSTMECSICGQRMFKAKIPNEVELINFYDISGKYPGAWIRSGWLSDRAVREDWETPFIPEGCDSYKLKHDMHEALV